MQKKMLLYSLVAFLLGVCTVLVYDALSKEQARDRSIDALTFDNTYTWDQYFLEAAQKGAHTERYTLPSPPKNSSRKTKKDLEILHDYQDKRTEENILEIQKEIYLGDAFFGDQTFAELTNKARRPKTFALMQYVIDFELPVILGQKLQYNRVRPSHLDPTLTPVIEVPHHPAYPSGHSTQAHIRADIFSTLDPENAGVYEAAAERIARNREIAGVHYPSDSKAGVIMAGQIMEALLENDTFLTLLEEAKTEW